MPDILYVDLSGNGKGVLDLNAQVYPSPGFMLRPAAGTTYTFTELLLGVGPFKWVDLSAGGSVAFAVGQEGYPEWFGVDGVLDDVEIQLAVNAFTITKLVPGKLYVGGDQRIVIPRPGTGKIYDFRGAVLRDIVISDHSYTGDRDGKHGTRTGGGKLLGGIFQRSVADLSSPSGPLLINSNEFHIDGSVVEELSGVQGYNDGIRIHSTAQRCTVQNTAVRAVTTGAFAPDGYIVSGRKNKLSNLSYEGFDDCITIKAATAFGDGKAATSDIQCDQVYSDKGANVFSVGSEIGFGVDNVIGTNLVGRDTGSIVAYEIGRLAGYAGGYLRNARAIGGEMFSDRCNIGAIYMHARGGCYGEQLHVSDMSGILRAESAAFASAAILVAADRQAQEGSMHDPTYINGLTIEDVDFKDRLDASAFVDATTAHPLDHLINIYELNGAYIKNAIIRRGRFRGCENAAIKIDCPSGNRLILEDIEVERWGTSVGGAAAIEITANSVLELHNFRARVEGGATRIFNLTNGCTVIAEEERLDLGSVPTNENAAVTFIAPKNCLILETFLQSVTGVTQTVPDHFAIDVRNQTTGNALFNSTTTNLVANTAVKLGTVGQYYSSAVGSDAYLSKGQALQLSITQVGAGRSLQGAVFIVRYIPYGD